MAELLLSSQPYRSQGPNIDSRLLTAIRHPPNRHHHQLALPRSPTHCRAAHTTRNRHMMARTYDAPSTARRLHTRRVGEHAITPPRSSSLRHGIRRRRRRLLVLRDEGVNVLFERSVRGEDFGRKGQPRERSCVFMYEPSLNRMAIVAMAVNCCDGVLLNVLHGG